MTYPQHGVLMDIRRRLAGRLRFLADRIHHEVWTHQPAAPPGGYIFRSSSQRDKQFVPPGGSAGVGDLDRSEQ